MSAPAMSAPATTSTEDAAAAKEQAAAKELAKEKEAWGDMMSMLVMKIEPQAEPQAD